MAHDVPDALARICADTRAEIARRKKITSEVALQAAIDANGDTQRGFWSVLSQAAVNGYGLIAEIKRASPSGGLIRPDFDPAALALAYKAGGAACLSVLTDEPYFQGSPDHLRKVRAAVDLPVLRKDFILDSWQLYESRAMGADCVLLILAALTDAQAVELERLARSLDLDVLAEVHNRSELDRALGLQTKMIGINNRNLKTLKTDINTTFELASHVPPDRFLIAESGISTHEQVRLFAERGIRSFLVGESLLRQPDVTAATRRLLGTAS
jgi:indole-3-glycerol phosphate synthase